MKRIFTVLSLWLLQACSYSLRTAGDQAPATQAPAATEAPAATQAPATGGGTLKIVSSLPMTGASLTQTQTIVNAEQLRLDQANNRLAVASTRFPTKPGMMPLRLSANGTQLLKPKTATRLLLINPSLLILVLSILVLPSCPSRF